MYKYTIRCLHEIIAQDPLLESPQARANFIKLDSLGIRRIYCIIIHKKGYESYVKFCLKKELGVRIEAGLFYVHTRIGNLDVMMLDQQLTWKLVLRHLLCTHDLVWLSKV